MENLTKSYCICEVQILSDIVLNAGGLFWETVLNVGGSMTARYLNTDRYLDKLLDRIRLSLDIQLQYMHNTHQWLREEVYAVRRRLAAIEQLSYIIAVRLTHKNCKTQWLNKVKTEWQVVCLIIALRLVDVCKCVPRGEIYAGKPVQIVCKSNSHDLNTVLQTSESMQHTHAHTHQGEAY